MDVSLQLLWASRVGAVRVRVMAGQASRKFPLLDQMLVEKSLMLPERSEGKVLQATVGDKVLLPEYGDPEAVLDDKDYFIERW